MPQIRGDIMEKSISICKKAAESSTQFEKNNSDLKRRYIIHNIQLYNHVVAMVDGNRGTFGTGYPFYALNRDLTITLPVIDEQLRYNNELITTVENSNYTTWQCSTCLSKNGSMMPDLKQICKICPNIEDALKPRKVLNRLPDIDMWMICKDNYISVAKEELVTLFHKYNLHPSDINPIQTIDDVSEIAENLENEIMPEKLLPLDAHIIGYSTLSELIKQVPSVLKQAMIDNQVPYLPIHPLSYRKIWQYDDAAYNFVHDYLSSLTEFNLDDDLQQLLLETRSVIANNYTFEQLYNYLIKTGPESVKNRHKTLELKDRFKERIESWKK